MPKSKAQEKLTSLRSLACAFKPLVFTCLLAVTLATSFSTHAKDYKVELIVFENLDRNAASESYASSEIPAMESGAEVWLIEPTMLLEESTAIKGSKSYRLIKHYSWGQESLPFDEAAAVNLIEPNLAGWAKIYARQLLYVNLDLEFQGYRLQEKRRIKLDEKHFFDHPKYGVLAQVSRLEPEEVEDAEENQTE
jgi:hypothetical protein